VFGIVIPNIGTLLTERGAGHGYTLSKNALELAECAGGAID
jgi:hypothetical protein